VDGKMQKIDSSLDQALKDSELRYRRLFETALDGILILDAQTGAITDVNPFLIDLLGYSRAEFLEKKLWEIGAFRDIPAAQDKFEVLQHSPIIRYEDLSLKTKDSRLIEVEFVSIAYQVGDQEVIQCNIRDITHRRLLEAKLKKSEEKNRAIASQSPDGIFLTDLQGNFLSVNRAIYANLDYSEDELLSMKIWDIVPVEYVDTHRRRLTKILRGEILNEPEEYVVRGKNGQTHIVEISSAPYYEENKIVGFQGIARDITRRKQVEENLRQSEERYKALYERSLEAVYLHDFEGRFLDANPAALNLLGVTYEEMLSLTFQDIFASVDQVSKAQTVLKEIQATGIQRELSEYRLKHKNGASVWVETLSSLVYKDGKPFAIQGIARDITARRQAEQALFAFELFNRKLVEASPAGIIYLDRDGKITYENPAMRRMTGLPEGSPSPVIGEKLVDLPSIQAAMSETNRKAILAGEPIHCELIHYRSLAGVEVDLEVYSTPLTDIQGLSEGTLLLALDITERKRATEALRTSEERYRTIFAESPFGIATVGRDFHFLSANAAFCSMMGYTEQELVLLTFRDITHPEHLVQDTASVNKLFAGEIPLYKTEKRYLRKDGGIVWAASTITVIRDVGGEVLHLVALVEDITERKSSEEQIRRSEQNLKQAQAVAHVGSWEWNVQSNKLDGSAEILRIFGIDQKTFFGSFVDLFAQRLHQDDRQKVDQAVLSVAQGKKPEPLAFRIVLPDKSVRHLWAETGELVLDERGSPALLTGIVQDISERMQAQEEIASRLAELEAVNKISTALRAAQSLDEMLPLLLDSTLAVLQAQRGIIWLYDQARDELRPAVSRGWEDSFVPAVKPGEQIAGYVYASKNTYLTGEYRQDMRLSEAVRATIPPGLGGAAVLILAGNTVIGVLSISVSLPRQVTLGEVHLLTTLSEIAGNAIQRTNLHEQTERRLRRLAALSDIDQVISSNFNLRISLDMLLDQVINQLEVDAADILLYNPALHLLQFFAGRGFQTHAYDHTQLRLGEGYAGRAALERRIINIQPLGEQTDNPRFTRALPVEPFTSFYAVPLSAKGQIKGVLEIFQRSLLEPDSEWLDFLNTLAGQAAIAIDVATLFENLERSNTELTLAYDATIEGWSRALDLRDKETEGHTQRVTEITVRLGRAFGLDEKELGQVRWGALLHDIGKMGIPDSILFKPSRLTDEEWVKMKKHPVYAYEMLSPVRYLRSALDIPYCHHEKWDGTGYPRGLKGEQIPLTARIFAVVDVWDALRSNRPYRLAWPEEKVLAHIRSLSGAHFDPQVVKAFFESDLFTDQ
jgi:PAS domain S-box-containing protein